MVTEYYRYTPLYRPPSTFTLPAGWELLERGTARGADFPLRTDLPQGCYRFGLVGYLRRLTDEECRRYDLQPV